jgi:hypothetical protein
MYKDFSRLWQYLTEFFLEWEMLSLKVVEKIKTRFMFHNVFFEYRAFYELMSKNVVKP